MRRRKFSREFKLEAVRLVKERGVSVAQAARDLDLHENVLRSQYTSEQFQRLMADHGIICSMSRSGNVWNNAAMESFFSSLKTERTARKVYRTRDDARADVFDYIERFYNPRRRHSTLGYLSPVAFEEQTMSAYPRVRKTGSRPPWYCSKVSMFDHYLQRWSLIPDGDSIATAAARLLPVRHNGIAAMLKISRADDARAGAELMEWWAGDGAPRILVRDGRAILLERATGAASMAKMAQTGHDDEACRIICAVAARLHAPRPQPMPELTPLANYFTELYEAAAGHGGLFAICAEVARDLLYDLREVCALHGDLHHGNVLDFGARGWLAIDAKGLVGERSFDFANIFLNPDLADPTCPAATARKHFARRLQIVAAAAGLEPARLLRWITAFAGLSAAWFLQEGKPAKISLRIAKLAAAQLGRGREARWPRRLAQRPVEPSA